MIQLPRKGEEGFTLVELLIVIVILGILAAVVVFAVSGITDRGQVNACKTDLSNLRAAEEAYFSTNSTYINESGLKTNGRISSFSTYHDVTVGADTAAATTATNSEVSSVSGAAYVIKYQSAQCGTVGAVAS